MPADLEVSKLQTLLAQERSHWKAVVSPLSHISAEQKKRRLGAVPPPRTATLQERERVAKERLAMAHPRNLGAAAAAPGFRPVSFDWRNVHGHSFVTPIRDQSSCGSCVAFGSIATVESTLRVIQNNPNFAVDLSEAQLFYCQARGQGRNCDNGWWPDKAMECLNNPGVPDEACYPYTPGDQNCTHLCPDWQQRVLRITGWHSLFQCRRHEGLDLHPRSVEHLLQRL
jgi:C1A family cysteine protease